MKNYLLLFMLVGLTLNSANAADYFWVGGSGNWSDISHWVTTSGGTVQHNTIPTAGDRVFFDERSFTGPNQIVTVNTPTVFCKDMVWTGATGRPVFSAPAAFILQVHGSLVLTEDMVFDFQGDVQFLANDPGHQIDLAGHALHRNAFFTGNAGEWALSAAFEVDSLLHWGSGTFRSSGYPISCEFFRMEPSGNLQIDLDTSYFRVTGESYQQFTWEDPFPVADIINRTNFLLNASGATMDFNSTNVYLRVRNAGVLRLGALIFSADRGKSVLHLGNPNDMELYIQQLVLRNDTELRGPLQLGELQLGAGKNFIFSAGYTYPLDNLVAEGACSSPIQLFSSEPGREATLRGVNGDFSGSYLSLRDIHASGGATFVADNSADLGNNAGWTIIPKTNTSLYWIGGSGNWNDPDHWSLSSGGPAGACVPTAGDDVFFDENSFSPTGGVVTLNIDNAYCRSMDWTGAGGNPSLVGTFEKNLHVFGSLTFIPEMQLDFEGDVLFESNNAGNTITSGGKKFNKDVTFDGRGDWILVDSLDVTRSLFFEQGGLNTNDQVLACEWFNAESNAVRSLRLGSSHIKMRSPDYRYLNWWLNADNLTFDAGTSTIEYFWYGDLRHLGRPQLRYHKVIFNYGASLNSDFRRLNHLIDTVEMRGGGYFSSSTQIGTWRVYRGNEYVMNQEDTLFVTNMVLPSDCSAGMVEFRSSHPSSIEAYIAHKVPLTLDRVIVKNFHSVGEGILTATNSVDLGNSDGWVIAQQAGRDLYWVGGTGLWHETQHWSLSSGGPGGECPPTPLDNVFFDENSFTDPNNQWVDMDARINYCKDLTWTNLPFEVSFTAVTLHVFGSITTTDEVNIEWFSRLLLRSDKKDNHIKIGGAGIIDNFEVVGGGEFILQDSLEVNYYLQQGGVFHSNGFGVKMDYFVGGWYWDVPKTLIMGGSHWKLLGADRIWQATWSVFGPMTFQVDSSLVEFTSSTPRIYADYGLNFNNVLFSAQDQRSIIETVNNASGIFNRVEFKNDGLIFGAHTIDSLIFSPGKSYQLDAYNTQVVRDYFQMTGNNCLSIGLSSTVPGQTSKVVMNGGVVAADFVQMRDQVAEGTTAFFAGANSTNIGNSNTGWIFESPEDYIDDGILGRDIVLCNNTSFELDGRTYSAGETYRWSTGAVTPTIGVDQPGTYWVELNYGDNCLLRDSIVLLEPEEFVADLPSDTALCEGETLLLEPQIELLGLQYLWQDSSRKSSFVVAEPGEYKLTLELTGCTTSDSLRVSYRANPVVDLGTDQVLCPDQTTMLNAFLPEATAYRWQDGSSQPDLLVSAPGTYVAEVLNGRCVGSDTVNVSYEPEIKPDLGRDTFFCEASSLNLGVRTAVGGTLDYLWSDGSASNTLRVVEDGLIWVEVTKNGCSARDSIEIIQILLPRFDLGSDITLCEMETANLGAELTDVTYLWNDGTTAGSNVVADDGLYWLEADRNGCKYRDSLTVAVVTLPDNRLGADQTICEGEQAVLDASVERAEYLWQDGSTSAILRVETEGVYTVEIAIGACRVTDEVSVRVTPLPRFDLGSDITLCGRETATLGAELTDVTYLWNDGTTAGSNSVAAEGLYWLEADREGCKYRDSLSVRIVTLPENRLGADQTICEGEQAVLDASVEGAEYLWQDGSTLPQLRVTSAGNYEVQVRIGSCSVQDAVSVSVLPLPVFELGPDLQLCAPESQVLQVNVPADSYRWQDGSTQRTFTAATTGLVRATATQAGCSWTDSLRIEIFDPPKPNLGLDTTLCEDAVLTLQVDGAAQDYQWQDGSTGSSFDVEFPGVYVLSAFEGPCVARDTIVVDFRRCTVFNAFLPNAFSPNGDGINDGFRPLLPPDVTVVDYTFRVFDRWGNLVFETNQIDREWDGTFRGNVLPQGVFLYSIRVRYQDDFGEDTAQLNGDILLTR